MSCYLKGSTEEGVRGRICDQLVLYATESASVHLNVFEKGRERGFAWTLIKTTTDGEQYAIQGSRMHYY